MTFDIKTKKMVIAKLSQVEEVNPKAVNLVTLLYKSILQLNIFITNDGFFSTFLFWLENLTCAKRIIVVSLCRWINMMKVLLVLPKGVA